MRKLIATLTMIFGLSLWLVSPASAVPAAVPGIQQMATSCGIWRWPVKTGADKDRYKVDKTAINTTVHYLRTRTSPSSFPFYYQNHRFRGVERHTYRLTALLTQFRLEDDGDIHLVLRNKAGKDMIAEIPSPGCVSTRSLWRNAIKVAKTTFTNHYPVTTSWHYVHRWITLLGLGFFDEIHNVTGQAPNGIELHPVTSVRFH